MINKKNLNFVSAFLIACLVSGIVLVSGKAACAQSLEPDPTVSRDRIYI